MMPESAEVAEIGIQDVDDEHRVQFRLLAGMQEAVNTSNREGAIGILQQLYNYSEAHFGAEQIFMRLHSYPACASHEREHVDLLGQLRQLIDAARAGEATDLKEWPKSIRRWLTSHINNADAAFGKWVKAEEQRVGQD